MGNAECCSACCKMEKAPPSEFLEDDKISPDSEISSKKEKKVDKMDKPRKKPEKPLQPKFPVVYSRPNKFTSADLGLASSFQMSHPDNIQRKDSDMKYGFDDDPIESVTPSEGSTNVCRQSNESCIPQVHEAYEEPSPVSNSTTKDLLDKGSEGNSFALDTFNRSSLQLEDQLSPSTLPPKLQNRSSRPKLDISVDNSILGEGAYLQYETANGGMIKLLWSKTGVPNAMCYAKPGVVLPKHKYSGPQRKQDLTPSGGMGSKPNGYTTAWCSFMKAAKQALATVYLLPAFNDAPLVHIYFVDVNSKVEILQPNVPMMISKDIKAVVALLSTEVFNGINLMEVTLFIQKGNTATGGFGMAL